MLAGSRWVPVKRGAAPYGILVCKDLTPDEPGETEGQLFVQGKSFGGEKSRLLSCMYDWVSC